MDLKLIHQRSQSPVQNAQSEYILSDGENNYSVFELPSGEFEAYQESYQSGASKVEDESLKGSLISLAQQHKQS